MPTSPILFISHIQHSGKAALENQRTALNLPAGAGYLMCFVKKQNTGQSMSSQNQAGPQGDVLRTTPGVRYAALHPCHGARISKAVLSEPQKRFPNTTEAQMPNLVCGLSVWSTR